MYRVGVTGGIASGKSVVASVLGELGAHVVEADEISREQVRPGGPVLDELVRVFGEHILHADGTLNRRALGAVAFGGEEELQELNAITHPPLTAEIARKLEDLERRDPGGVAVVDAALLLDWPIAESMDLIVVVCAPEKARIERMMSQGRTEEDARSRIEAQRPDDWYAARADLVLENTGSLRDLLRRAEELWNRILDRKNESAR